jgi:hypothetical protein
MPIPQRRFLVHMALACPSPLLYSLITSPSPFPTSFPSPLWYVFTPYPAYIRPPSSPKFDQGAPARRLGKPLPEHVKTQLHHRRNALKCFRRADVYDPHLPDALLNAYIMLLEDDGKNSALLLESGLLPLLETYLRRRLAEGSADNHGWPIENETNCFAIAIFFLLSSQCMFSFRINTPRLISVCLASLQAESTRSSAEILDLLAPFVFAGFRVSANDQLLVHKDSQPSSIVSLYICPSILFVGNASFSQEIHHA